MVPTPTLAAPPTDLLDTAPCGFVSFADDGTIATINATLLRMLGYERDELLGRHVESIMTVATRIFYQTHFFPLLRLHGRAEEIFFALRGKQGGEVGVLANAVRHERGGMVANDCVVLEVRERRKYEDELLRARKAAEHAQGALEVRNRELEQANAQLQLQATELETQAVQLDEQATELQLTGDALRMLNDQLAARTDEAERARVEAERANRAKSEFLAVMSHELRTPLNAIGGYVQLLEMGIHGPVTEAQRESLERIARSQRHLLGLINDVLNLARIESGRVEYVLADVLLAELVAGVLPMIEPQLAAKGLMLTMHVTPELEAHGDREKVKQILLNLLTNAVKFTPAGGGVTVDAGQQPDTPDTVFLRVTDTGIGIPAEKLETIFEPFVQVDASRTRLSEGTGLGLAISRDLARGMGGDLRASSVEGQGSTFTLVLPRGGRG